MVKKIFTAFLFLLSYSVFFLFVWIGNSFALNLITTLFKSSAITQALESYGMVFAVLFAIYFCIYSALLTVFITRRKGWDILKSMARVLPILWCITFFGLAIVFYTALFNFPEITKVMGPHGHSIDSVILTEFYYIFLSNMLLLYAIASIVLLLYCVYRKKVFLFVFMALPVLAILHPSVFYLQRQVADYLSWISAGHYNFMTLPVIIIIYVLWAVIFLGLFFLSRRLLKEKDMSDMLIFINGGIWLFIIGAGIMLHLSIPLRPCLCKEIGPNDAYCHFITWRIALCSALPLLPALIFLIWGRSKKAVKQQSSEIGTNNP